MTDEKQSHRYTQDDVLDAVKSAKPSTTTNVAGELNCTREGAFYRLRRLRDAGNVESEMIGNTLIWSIIEGE